MSTLYLYRHYTVVQYGHLCEFQIADPRPKYIQMTNIRSSNVLGYLKLMLWTLACHYAWSTDLHTIVRTRCLAMTDVWFIKAMRINQCILPNSRLALAFLELLDEGSSVTHSHLWRTNDCYSTTSSIDEEMRIYGSRKPQKLKDHLIFLTVENLCNHVRHTTFDVRHTCVRIKKNEIKRCRVPHAALPPCLCHLRVNPPYTVFQSVFPRFFKILRLFRKEPLSNLSIGLNKLCFEEILRRTARQIQELWYAGIEVQHTI